MLSINNKHIILERIAEKFRLSLNECAIIGDDITDLTLIRRAGFSVAFCPKNDKLKKYADVIINEKDLSLVLNYFP